MKCKVSEIYPCILGESRHSGRPATLVRFAGCNLRCRYCDTSYSWLSDSGEDMTVESVVDRVMAMGMRMTLLTGGEPLVQKESALSLCKNLVSSGVPTLIETNGSVDLAGLPSEVTKVVDVKCPDSGHGSSFLMENLSELTDQDDLKFVLSSREDYDWATGFVRQHCAHLPGHCILFSPAAGRIEPEKLAEWILGDRLDVRFHLQIHKVVWGDRRGV